MCVEDRLPPLCCKACKAQNMINLNNFDHRIGPNDIKLKATEAMKNTKECWKFIGQTSKFQNIF